MPFPEKLKKLRSEKELTLKRAAEEIGVSGRTLQNYESGRCMPRSSETANRIAEFYGVPLSELVEPEDFYLINAEEKGGIKAKRELSVLLSELNALYAGGKLSEDDRSLMLQTLNEIYWDSKEKAVLKYTPKSKR